MTDEAAARAVIENVYAAWTANDAGAGWRVRAYHNCPA
jgi:hypothetical protein